MTTSPKFTDTTFTSSGLDADNVGHVMISQVGAKPLHVPSARHVRVLDPDNEYPIMHK